MKADKYHKIISLIKDNPGVGSDFVIDLLDLERLDKFAIYQGLLQRDLLIEPSSGALFYNQEKLT